MREVCLEAAPASAERCRAELFNVELRALMYDFPSYKIYIVSTFVCLRQQIQMFVNCQRLPEHLKRPARAAASNHRAGVSYISGNINVIYVFSGQMLIGAGVG